MLTGSLATTGLIVLVIYIIGMLGIGVYCNKKYANNLSGFLTGGRSVGPWVFALTYGSTYLSASTFIGNTGTAYKAGAGYPAAVGPDFLLARPAQSFCAPERDDPSGVHQQAF